MRLDQKAYSAVLDWLEEGGVGTLTEISEATGLNYCSTRNALGYLKAEGLAGVVGQRPVANHAKVRTGLANVWAFQTPKQAAEQIVSAALAARPELHTLWWPYRALSTQPVAQS